MTLLTHRDGGPTFRYAGQPVSVLAGQDGQPPGFAAMEMAIPARFGGPIPHAHDEFDEAIYVLGGRLLVAGDEEPEEAVAGSMFVAPPRAPAQFPQSLPGGRPGAGHLDAAWACPCLHAGHRCGAHPQRPARPGPDAGHLRAARQPAAAMTRQHPDRVAG
jgi:hypothetical protein